MNLFKKYATPVLLVAMVASCSSIEAIDLNYWLGRARSGASQAYDVLKRKKVWMPIAATAAALLMIYGGKKIWQKKIDSYKAEHENLCRKMIGDLKIMDNLSTSMTYGVQGEFLRIIDDNKKAIKLLKSRGARLSTLTELFPTELFDKALLSNVSQFLAFQCTDISSQINDQVAVQENRIAGTLDVLDNIAEKLKKIQAIISYVESDTGQKNFRENVIDKLKFEDGSLRIDAG